MYSSDLNGGAIFVTALFLGAFTFFILWLVVQSAVYEGLRKHTEWLEKRRPESGSTPGDKTST